MTVGCVTAAADGVCQRIEAGRRVESAGGVGKKRGATIRRILGSVGITIKHLHSIGCIIRPGRVVI